MNYKEEHKKLHKEGFTEAEVNRLTRFRAFYIEPAGGHFAQVTIPTDNVDATFIHKPRRWNISLIRDFMIFIGPISSIYDFLTFFIMLGVFNASEALFHT